MAKVTGYLLLLGWLCLGSPRSTADVLVFKNGKRMLGQVQEEEEVYVLSPPRGGQIRVPKSSVREVIQSEAFRAEYEKRRRETDVLDGAALARLLEFCEERGLAQEQETLCADAYAQRAERAGEDVGAWRQLAAWCQEQELPSQEALCRKRLDVLEYRRRRACAGLTEEELESLAQWCRARDLGEQSQECLSGLYQEKRQRAQTPRDFWDLAAWCHRSQLQASREEHQIDAVREAFGEQDLEALETFSQEARAERSWAKIQALCAAAVFGLRSEQAGDDPLAQARLSVWCLDQGRAAHAQVAEERALARAPDRPDVRAVLDYVRNSRTQQWEKDPRARVLVRNGTGAILEVKFITGTRTVARCGLRPGASTLTRIPKGTYKVETVVTDGQVIIMTWQSGVSVKASESWTFRISSNSFSASVEFDRGRLDP